MSNTASSTTKHTPPPWRVVVGAQQGVMIRDEEGDTIAHVAEYGLQSCRPNGQAENAAFIVRACNNHEQLVTALRAIVDSLAESDEEGLIEHTETMMNARAALAAAEA